MLKMAEVLEKAIKQHSLGKDEVVFLLNNQAEENLLFSAADTVRKQFVGDEVHLRGLIEFSNICKNNCLYCGIRRDNKQVQRYRLEPDEIIKLASQAKDYGFGTIVLQSGEDLYFTPERMAYIVSNIKKLDVAVTLSIGEKSYEEYKAYKDAGADRYLIRIETTDKDLYHRLDPEMSWDERKECLVNLRKLGYEVGSGIMVGLPGQTIESIAEDLLFLKEMDIDMAGIGPFIPHPCTPLANEEGRAFDLSLRTMAVMRLLMPDINIPATTAMESLNPEGRIIALKAGANVIMPNVTDKEYRNLYALYPGKPNAGESSLAERSAICEKIVAIGRTIGKGYGGHKRLSL